jgi:hypothetical protein
MTQNDGENCRSEEQDLRAVHWTFKLLVSLHLAGLLRDAEQLVAEVVGLLVQSLLTDVVLDALQVRVRYWQLGRFILKGQENSFEALLDFVTKHVRMGQLGYLPYLVRLVSQICQFLALLLLFDQYL